MSNIDFTAHKHLSNAPLNAVQLAIEEAQEKADKGHFLVCVTESGDVEILTQFTASVRDDISETVYDTDSGYNFSIN